MRFTPDGSTAIALADATEVASRVDEYIRGNHATAVLSVLSKSESIASSLMEDIGGPTHSILLALDEDDITSDPIRSVVKNIHLTDAVIRRFSDRAQPIGVEDIIRLQSELIQYRSQGRTFGAEFVGIKQDQNRIGGNSLFDAEFIPTPPEYMDEYLLDLVNFINQHEHTNPIVAAAFVHAQFETLHPFPDGNGRTGRAIIQGMLRRDGVVRHSIFPISTVLKGRAEGYVEGLNSFRQDGPADSGKINAWITSFAHALADAAQLAKTATDELIDLQSAWRREMTGIRSTAIDHKVIDSVLENLAVHAASIAKEFDVSKEAARNSLHRLEKLGILEVRSRQRRHIYYPPAVVSIIDDIEVEYRTPAQVRLELPGVADPEEQNNKQRRPRCNSYMPNSRAHCTLRPGHPGHHQHK